MPALVRRRVATGIGRLGMRLSILGIGTCSVKLVPRRHAIGANHVSPEITCKRGSLAYIRSNTPHKEGNPQYLNAHNFDIYTLLSLELLVFHTSISCV